MKVQLEVACARGGEMAGVGEESVRDVDACRCAMIGEPSRFADAREGMRKAVACFVARDRAALPGDERGGGPTENARDVHTIADFRAGA